MLQVAAFRRAINIIGDHLANDIAAVRLSQQMLRECRRGDRWNMLVLSDGEDLVLVQATERDAVDESDHGPFLPKKAQDRTTA
jgi:hypothetical protein